MLSLVWPAENNRFRLHSLVRSHLRARLYADGGYNEGLEKLSLYLADTCHIHFLHLFSLKEDPLSVIERYPDEILEAWSYALRGKRWDMALKIAIPPGSYLHLARFYMALGHHEELWGYAGFVLQSPLTSPGSRTEMEALFMLSILRVNKDNKREISLTYLMRALQSARKNCLYASAAGFFSALSALLYR